MLNCDTIGNPPLSPEARDVLREWTAENPPSPLHPAGDVIADAVERAREQVASLVGTEPRGLVVTASGSEALNLALKGLAWGRRRPGPVAVSAVEHPAVVHPARFLERWGYPLRLLRCAWPCRRRPTKSEHAKTLPRPEPCAAN